MEQLQDEGRIALRDEPVSQENFEIASPIVYKRNGYLFIKRCFDIAASLVFAVLLMIPSKYIGVRFTSLSPVAFFVSAK